MKYLRCYQIYKIKWKVLRLSYLSCGVLAAGSLRPFLYPHPTSLTPLNDKSPNEIGSSHRLNDRSLAFRSLLLCRKLIYKTKSQKQYKITIQREIILHKSRQQRFNKIAQNFERFKFHFRYIFSFKRNKSLLKAQFPSLP